MQQVNNQLCRVSLWRHSVALFRFIKTDNVMFNSSQTLKF